MTTITLKGLGQFKIEIGQYISNNNTSVVLYSTDSPLGYIKLSLNPPIELPKDEFVVKNYSENIGIPEQVINCGLFTDTGKTFTLPHNLVCPIWRIRN